MDRRTLLTTGGALAVSALFGRHLFRSHHKGSDQPELPIPSASPYPVLPRGALLGVDTAWRSTHFINPNDLAASFDSRALPDEKELAANGVAYHIAKSGQDTDYDDPFLGETIENARSANMIPGIYHFLGRSNGADQADANFARLKKIGGWKGLLHCIDFEEIHDNILPTFDILSDYIAEYRRRLGGIPLFLYIRSDLIQKTFPPDPALHQKVADTLKDVYLWWPAPLAGPTAGSLARGPILDLAAQVSPPGSPDDPYPVRGPTNYWPHYSLRQYTWDATCGDYDGRPRGDGSDRTLDCNIFFGSRDRLRKMVA